jgi:acetyltransferase-like isoleucine patch superfamily enzyme
MLSKLRNRVRDLCNPMRNWYLCRIWGHKIDPTARVSWSAFLDRTRPEEIEVGSYTVIAAGACLLSHDFASSRKGLTRVGDNCFVGARAIVLPGICIGNHSVIGAGSVVTEDIAPGSLAVGNPARVIARIETGRYGRILRHDPLPAPTRPAAAGNSTDVA